LSGARRIFCPGFQDSLEWGDSWPTGPGAGFFLPLSWPARLPRNSKNAGQRPVQTLGLSLFEQTFRPWWSIQGSPFSPCVSGEALKCMFGRLPDFFFEEWPIIFCPFRDAFFPSYGFHGKKASAFPPRSEHVPYLSLRAGTRFLQCSLGVAPPPPRPNPLFFPHYPESLFLYGPGFSGFLVLRLLVSFWGGFFSRYSSFSSPVSSCCCFLIPTTQLFIALFFCYEDRIASFGREPSSFSSSFDARSTSRKVPPEI